MVAARLSEFEVRDVTSPDELNLCVRLYEEVFRLGPGDGSINTRLLVGLVRNSGIVVGAFAGAEMIGFALSFLALDRERQTHYQYSQLAVVTEAAQGRGVGRQLKNAQRDAARSMGVVEMRWSFDPFLVRNAHFNLNVLEARAFKLERNLYGTYAHGLDVEETTDRLLVVWDLSSSSPKRREPGETDPLDGANLTLDRPTLVVPAASARQPDKRVRRQRDAILDAFDDFFAKGFVAVGCDLQSDERATYTFENVGVV